jgi:hypothetical protein
MRRSRAAEKIVQKRTFLTQILRYFNQKPVNFTNFND